jgi:type IV secretory pathway VirB2 component (pilin)
MKKTLKILFNKKIVLLLLFFLAGTVLFAQNTSTTDFGLGTHVATILAILSSPWVKGIACIALIIECIGLIFMGRQEPGMFKKFIPWIAGTILFMAAGTITSNFINIENNKFSSDLGLTSTK